MTRFPPSALVLLALASTAADAFALDPFEIQVYDGTANPPGVFGLELHVNYVASGLKTAVPPELPQDRQGHLTLEPSVGVLPWWELGGYFETALRADGTFDYAGVKLRSKFVTPPGWDAHWRLGVNVEASLLPERYDRNRWATELRPIAAWENERWHFAINPIVDTALAGPEGSAGPRFEPAAMAVCKLPGASLSAGLEYYADLGPFGAVLPLREQQHYLFEVVNVLSVPRLELNAGIGEGLTPGSNVLVAKVIVGYAWDRDAQPPSSAVGGRRAVAR